MVSPGRALDTPALGYFVVILEKRHTILSDGSVLNDLQRAVCLALCSVQPVHCTGTVTSLRVLRERGSAGEPPTETAEVSAWHEEHWRSSLVTLLCMCESLGRGIERAVTQLSSQQEVTDRKHNTDRVVTATWGRCSRGALRHLRSMHIERSDSVFILPVFYVFTIAT